MQFERFETWADVVSYAREHGHVWYHAPLDTRPTKLEAKLPKRKPRNSTVPGEGANPAATATCHDNAGNSTTTTVSGIQIDRTAAATLVSVSGAVSGGWYHADNRIELEASDNLSGVDLTYYSVPAHASRLRVC
jgi:hypothetical protein